MSQSSPATCSPNILHACSGRGRGRSTWRRWRWSGRRRSSWACAWARSWSYKRGACLACLFRTQEGTQYLASVAVVWTEAVKLGVCVGAQLVI